MDVVMASSPVDAGIGCWDLRNGSGKLRYHSCASPPEGLCSVAGRFVAASQLPDSSSTASAPIFFWSWDKPRAEVESFPCEPIGPLVSNSEGTYIIGGGLSGTIYLWEAVTCLALSDDESMLISGGKDTKVKVLCLLKMFGELESGFPCYTSRNIMHGHILPVRRLVAGRGLSNQLLFQPLMISRVRLLRSISFPSTINALALDPGEHVVYAGSEDGNIYIAALHPETNDNSALGMFVIGALCDKRFAITCLAMSTDGVTLISGSEDGNVRVWDTRSTKLIHVLKHANVEFVDAALLGKYIDSINGHVETKAVTLLQPHCHDPEGSMYYSCSLMMMHIKELQQRNYSGANEMELERARLEHERSKQLVQQWKKLYQDLQSLCATEIMNGEPN